MFLPPVLIFVKSVQSVISHGRQTVLFISLSCSRTKRFVRIEEPREARVEKLDLDMSGIRPSTCPARFPVEAVAFFRSRERQHPIPAASMGNRGGLIYGTYEAPTLQVPKFSLYISPKSIHMLTLRIVQKNKEKNLKKRLRAEGFEIHVI